MEKIVVIGSGNCGGQIALLAERKYPDIFSSIYINTSKTDLSMIRSENGLKFKIGNDEEVEGSGKNRDKMKEYLEADISKILEDRELQDRILSSKYCFIIASGSGGSGSGSAPILMEFMRQMFPDTHFILVGILPHIGASLTEQGNTIEFLTELYDVLGPSTTYMLYDNETAVAAGLSSTKALEVVNENIVEDMRIISGIDNFATPYESIDDADMESIVSTPGRLVVTRLTKGLTEKAMEDYNLDDMIIKAIKNSSHAETDRNKRVVRWGVITYFNEAVNNLYKSSLDGLVEFIGTPVERFNHNSINDKSENLNFLYLIASGLSPINDRTQKITDRIKELEAALAGDDTNRSILSDGTDATNSLRERRNADRKTSTATSVNPKDIFSKFKK